MRKKWLSLICFLVILFSLCPAAQGDMTPGDLNNPGSCRIEAGFKVYTGPGKNYLQVNGNASMNDAICRVWGYDGKWLMIGYQTSAGNYRVGYVDKSALNYASGITGTVNQELELLYDDGVISKKSALTDDPYIKNTSFATLAKGTEVFVLGYLAEWTYVEVVLSDGTPARGFVKSANVKSDGEGGGGSKIITEAPTKKPVTAAPITAAPITAAPITAAPITAAPITVPPVTAAPITVPPITAAPITAAPYSNNSLLQSLTHNCPNTGKMLPETFSPYTTNYILTVASWVSRVQFTPTAFDKNALITINGQPIASGAASSYYNLSNDPLQITINVIAVNGQTTTYTVFVQRRPSEARTRVSAGYIRDIYQYNNAYYISADLININYTGQDYASGNRSNYTNDSSYLYRYAVDVHCDFYYGSGNDAVRASDIFEFMAHYQSGSGSGMYTIIYLEDKIVAVYPYESESYLYQKYYGSY